MIHDAIYVRVSSKVQDHRSQLLDLQRWAKEQDTPIQWYTDKATGRNMNRPGWKALEAALKAGKVRRITIWRLDRLGRTVKGLATLFEDLIERKVTLISLRDSIDLLTPTGRLVANVLASVAQYTSEVIGDNVRAGIAAVRAANPDKKWGYEQKGIRKKVTEAQEAAIRSLRLSHTPIAAIAKAVNLSRPTIYSVLADSAPSSIA